MKKLTLLALIGMIVLSSCSFETYYGCVTYSNQNKMTHHGTKAQSKYSKRNTKRNSLI